MNVSKIIKLVLVLFLTITSVHASSHLVRGNFAEPATLDPTLSEENSGTNIMRDLFEALMTEDGEGNVIPGQAQSYTISEDKTVYTFKIRNNAKWSNGDAVTAHDFEYAFKRGVNPLSAAKYSWYFKILGIKNGAAILDGKMPVDSLGVKALDNQTLKITLDKPIPYFLIGVAHITTAPIHQKTVEKLGNKWTRPGNMVSNGAYTLKQWVVNEKIVLSKNNNYYAKDKVKIDQVTFLPITDASTELKRYKAGEIDFTTGIPKSQFKHLKKNYPNELKVLGKVGTYYYHLNMRKKPYDDVRVRKALSYAINREVIAKKVQGSGELPAYTFVPNTISGYTPPTPSYELLTQKQRNIKAIELLNEAGISKINPLKLELLYNTSDGHKRIALAVNSMWKRAFKGAVIVTLKNQEWKTFLEEKRLGNFEVGRAGWTGDYNEASTMLDILTKGHSTNSSFYDNPMYDKLMNEARVTIDDKKRNKLYQKIDLIITEDMPIIPIYQYATVRMVKTRVGGYPKVNPLDTIYTRHLYLKK